MTALVVPDRNIDAIGACENRSADGHQLIATKLLSCSAVETQKPAPCPADHPARSRPIGSISRSDLGAQHP